jgi:tetratricopeptide (TPR) repeat protein
MPNRHYQRVFILTAGLWFMVCSGVGLADDLHTKSKALAYYIMAVVDDLNGENQKAISEYEKSSKYDRRQPLPHLRLSAYYARLGRSQDAINQLNIVLKLQPNSSQAHYLLALVYSSQKKYDLAADQYELILKNTAISSSESVEAHAYLAQLYFALHKYPQTQQQITEILQFQPRNVSALYLEGSTYLELNQIEKAKEDFRKILGIEPNHDGALNSLAYMYAEESRNLDEALKMVKKAIDLDPSNGAYYDTLGWVLFKQGFHAESLMALEKAQTYITDPIIYDHMGDVYKASNESALARKFWLKSLSIDPKQVKIRQKLEELNKTSANSAK